MVSLARRPTRAFDMRIASVIIADCVPMTIFVTALSSIAYAHPPFLDTPIAATLKHETENALLVNDGDKYYWLPKNLTENNGDGKFTILEWLAIEKGIV
jgi:hypothetical protein